MTASTDNSTRHREMVARRTDDGRTGLVTVGRIPLLWSVTATLSFAFRTAFSATTLYRA